MDRLAFEDRAYIESRHESPGGRGINAACVIHSFGGKPLAIFPSGGADARGYELREATTDSLDVSAPYVFNDRAATSSHEPLIEAGPRVRKVGARCIFDFPSGFPSRASTSAKLASAARGSVLNKIKSFIVLSRIHPNSQRLTLELPTPRYLANCCWLIPRLRRRSFIWLLVSSPCFSQ